MKTRGFAGLLTGAVALGLGAEARAVGLTPLTTTQVWSRLEFRVTDVPLATNPFDPASISVDATFTAPAGRSMIVPAFWYQGYQRRLVNGAEQLQPQGTGEWRLRFTPPQAGDYQLRLTVVTNGQPAGAPYTSAFTVPPATGSTLPSGTSAPEGYVRLATNRLYFATDQGNPLPLIGACVCWYGSRGTYDYDDWFASMGQAGENYARLWMAPWAFGLEADPGTGTHYRQDHAWQLDYVLQLAEQRGIYLMFCLDYHGMFETKPDYWGGNNYWPKNPYNVANGGPCVNQDAFFTNPAAQAMYQKRLRYLIGRYGYSPHLLVWQFFNELDNVYAYLNATHVATWHAVMGDWLRAHDPYQHLITTSMTGGSDRPEIWRLPEMDFATYHSYNLPQPTAGLAGLIQSFLARYQKPVLIDEYGVDWHGWARTNDPYLRGFRQGLWAGALGGAVGTSMSWWWQEIQSENVYPYYRALATFTQPTGWGQGRWSPAGFQTTGPPPASVGDAVANGRPFSATLELSTQWGASLPGQLALATPLSATLAPSALNAFVQGATHPDLRLPFRIAAWLGTNAQLVLHLNSVSDGAIMGVLVDGQSMFSQSVPNRDGLHDVNNEYNQDFTVALPAGKHLIEIKNLGADWFYLDWVRLTGVLPAQYPGGWQPSPVAAGVTGERETLVYVVNPAISFPANATNPAVDPWRGGALLLTNVPAGRYQALWYDPRTGQPLGQTIATNAGAVLVVPLPDFSEDLAGRLLPAHAFSLRSPAAGPAGSFLAALQGDASLVYQIETSRDLTAWTPLLQLTNSTPATDFSDPAAAAFERRFYRARLGAE